MELPAPTKETWWYDEYATLLEEELRIERERVKMAVMKAKYDYDISYPGDVTVASNGSVSVVTNDGNAIPVNSELVMDEKFINKMLNQADSNLLSVIERVSHEAIQRIGEDEFKKRAKEVLGTKLGQETAKKAKFTMLKDPRNEETITKGRVYVFSEEELKTFIKNVAKQVK